MSNPVIKPLLRGHFHQSAFFTALGACLVLVGNSSTPTMFAASSIYSISLLLNFGISALYHRPNWAPKARARMKRLDHSAIFIVIAGTMTPFCLLALPNEDGLTLLSIGWGAALLGIAQSLFWVRAPVALTSLLYVGMGWSAVPYLGEFKQSLGTTQVVLIVLGGVIYTLGAIIYATKRPALNPRVFGYHELFHVCTIIAATLHFLVIHSLIQ